jgi:hypothetical protein
MSWILIAGFLIILYGLIDYYIIKRWAQESLNRINGIFDSFKSFFFIQIIERLNNAINFEDDYDDLDEEEIK